jgi:3-polyprenyl-4-hydroxybenzoate decarboxylase
VNVFLGVTGASGAPYAARLLRALTDAGCEVGLSASAAGIEVLATELYGDAALPREDEPDPPRRLGRAQGGP